MTIFDIPALLAIPVLINEAITLPLIMLWITEVALFLYAIIAILALRRKIPPSWWLRWGRLRLAIEDRYLRWFAIPYLATVPASFVWDILDRSVFGFIGDAFVTWLFWRAWKNRPRKKKKPNKVLGVIRERAGRLVVVPQPA